MTTMVIDVQNRGDAQKIADTLRLMKSVKKIVIQEIDSECIPGLPYTREERIASVHKSMEEVRAGHTITSEELKKRMATW